jgi:hypothetical protein
MSDGSVQIIKKYDEALISAESRKYKLSIQLSLDGFYFSIYHPEQNKFLSLESISFGMGKNQDEYINWLKDLIKSHEWLKLPFDEVKLLIEINKSTLIPDPLFDKNELETYVNFNFKQQEGLQLNHDIVSTLDAHIVYAYPGKVIECVREFYPELIFKSHSSNLIESLILKYKNAIQQKRTFVHVRRNHLDIIILEGKKLLYFNTFNFRTKEDFIYYVIFVIEQLGLNPEEIDLILLGLIDQQSGLFDMIYKYVRNIRFIESDENRKYSYIFDEFPSHYYYNLLNL